MAERKEQREWNYRQNDRKDEIERRFQQKHLTRKTEGVY